MDNRQRTDYGVPTAATPFDTWADTYDSDVQRSEDRYPFAGYDAVLRAVVDETLCIGPARVLDLGCGTGALLALIGQAVVDVECWGIDFSPRMLEAARRRVPVGHFVQADYARELARLALPRFDSIVSTYAFHEAADELKLRVIEHLWRERLNPGGTIVIGDIAFATERDRDALRVSLPDWDDEHYLVAERFQPRLAALGLRSTYRQISFCAGVLTIFGSTPGTPPA